MSSSAYHHLQERLQRFPQGAPASQNLTGILAILFSEREADLVSRLPIRPFTATQAARAWKVGEAEARTTLEKLTERALLIDMVLDPDDPASTRYVLPPPMAGFFEFSLMRVREDIDQKLLAELFYQYLNVEEDFLRALFTDGEMRLGRTFVEESALSPENVLQVLDYERASEVVRTATHRGVSLCYCRRKMGFVDRACAAPLDVCLTLNGSAASLIRHGTARALDTTEALDILARSREQNLVQFGENVRQGVNFICNCCGCCCEGMQAARRFANFHPVATTPFFPEVDRDMCTGCGACVRVCPVEAAAAVSANDPHRPKRSTVRFDVERCLGCGVCVRACSSGALALRFRGERRLTPADTAHRAVLMAVERGKLAEFVFDNQVLWNRRALVALLGAFFKLTPVQRLLGSRQVRSRYLEDLSRRMM